MLRSTNARERIGSKSMTSFSRAMLSVPPAAPGLAAACAGVVGAAAGAPALVGAAAGLAGWLVAPVCGWPAPPHAATRLIAPALNRLLRKSRREASFRR